MNPPDHYHPSLQVNHTVMCCASASVQSSAAPEKWLLHWHQTKWWIIASREVCGCGEQDGAGTLRWWCRCVGDDKESKLDVRQDSRGVDGWRNRVGGAQNLGFGAVQWPLIPSWSVHHSTKPLLPIKSTRCHRHPSVNHSFSLFKGVGEGKEENGLLSFYASHLGSH